MTEKKIRLIIKSRIENVALLCTAVKSLCATEHFTTDALDSIELCIAEAINNVIMHAFNNEKGHDIQLELTLNTSQVSMTIEHEMRKLMTEQHPTLIFNPHDISSIPEGGMGLYILASSMDKLIYEVVNGKNRLTMIKRMNG